MKKNVLFVILEGFADWEAAYLSTAIRTFNPDQYDVKTVSLEKKAVESIGGFRVIPDYDIHDMPKDYEALILIGGTSWRGESAQQIRPLAESCFHDGRILGGICDASAFLGTIGLLNDVRHTSNDCDNLKQWAQNAYTGEKNYIVEPAVRDETIITANGVSPLEFAREVLMALNIAPENEILKWYQFYKYGIYEGNQN
ncbi:MAG: glutamine amidotransferase [Hungatella sp.]|nr:glutamine amidotransferase [Hungatella sp.]